MFTKDKKTVVPKTLERNSLAKNTSIVGDLVSEGDFRIDGTLEGTLNTKGKVIVGPEGYIKGTMDCSDADIEGKFSGELKVANLLTVKSSATVSGNVVMGKLSVESGASFDTVCNMKGAVKGLTKNKQKEQTKETA